MLDFTSSLTPWPGSRSGETFLAEVAGEEVVLRIYGAASMERGPLAPEIDAAVLDLVRDLLPVPAVLEVRRGNPDADLPGLLVTSRLPGEGLDVVRPRLDEAGLKTVGASLGTIAGRLRHMVQTRPGGFKDHTLVPSDPPPVGDGDSDLGDGGRGACLVHGDLGPNHVLLDPVTLEVSGLVGWETAHSGRPLADLERLLSTHESPSYTDGVQAGYHAMLPGDLHGL
jgi:hypothetical protein